MHMSRLGRDVMPARQAVFASLLALGHATACQLDDATPRDIEPGRSDVLHAQLELARVATAKYRDVAVAEADGFVSGEECVFDPVLGTMGIHFAHEARLADPAVRIEEPEALLYVREGGELRLVAIEYLQVILIEGVPYLGCGTQNNTCPPSNPPPPPRLFDRVSFEGPMAGHVRGMPWHYDLHAWIWAPNPAGMFAEFNPALSCK